MPLPKLLIVDDDCDLRKTVAVLLAACAEILEAPDGAAAIELVKRERPRLILLDVTMPGMDGIETLAAVRRLDPAVTVIMLTGEKELDIARRALELGAKQYVTKPFDLEYLRGEVERILSPAPQSPDDDGRPWRIQP